MTVLTKPIIPQTEIGFTSKPAPRITPSFSDTVAIPLTHDWGPLGSDAPGADKLQGGPQLVTSFDDFTNRFGDSDTPGRTAVAGAFAGKGFAAGDGAGGVLVYRMATGAAAKATIAIQNTTPAAALTLTAKYAGTRGNRISYAIDANPANAAQDRLRVMLDGVVAETYLYTPTDIAGLAAAINARPSNLVRATETLTGVRLTATAGVSLAGGNDGAVLTAAEWLAAQDALEFENFELFAPFDLTDAAILAALRSWVLTQVSAGRPMRAVVGGLPAETIDDALTRTGTLADPHFVNFGGGTWHDDLLAKDLSTSQLAPRIAGILAASGKSTDLTGAKIAGLHRVGATNPTTADIEAAVQGGVVTLMRTVAADADVRIAKGVTTWTNDAVLPVDVWGDSRLVGILDWYVRTMKQWGDDNGIGRAVNDDSRAGVYGEARRLQDQLLADGLILPGDDVVIPKPYVNVRNTDSDPNLRDTIPYDFGWQFARTANAILGNGVIS